MRPIGYRSCARGRGGIDHDDVAAASLGRRSEKPVPDTGLPPADEAVAGGVGRAVALRDFRPGRSRPKAPQDAVPEPDDPRPEARRAARSAGAVKGWATSRR